MTEHARNLWGERSFAKAFDLLDCLIGVTREQQESILFGKSQLVGVNDLDLVSDDWTPPEHYASFNEALTQGTHWPELQLAKENEAWEYARRNWWITRGNKGRVREFFDHLVGLVGNDKAEEINTAVMHEIVEEKNNPGSYYAETQLDEDHPASRPKIRERVSTLEMIAHDARQRMMMSGLDPSAIPTTDALLNRGTNIKPKKCQDMSSECGWLLPNGDYYGCTSMEHIGLAGSLMPDYNGDPEQEAERRGWIKISRGVMGLYVMGSKTASQKQLDRLLDYSEFHKQNYKRMIAALPESL